MRHFILLSALGVVGCGVADNTIKGTFQGHEITPRSAAFGVKNGTDISAAAFVQADVEDICRVFGDARAGKSLEGDGTMVSLMVSDTSSIKTQHYEKKSGPMHQLGAGVSQWKDGKELPNTPEAPTASIDIKELNDNQAEVTYDMTLGSGDRLSGSFKATKCKAIDDALNIQN